MTPLAQYVTAKQRFSRSANIERDHGASAISGYVPTGRAIDVVDRISRGLIDPSAGRTFSITGPHGGGKSSLAVFIAALLSPEHTAEYKAAIRLLDNADRAAGRRLRRARKAIGLTGRHGVIAATATARAESVAATIARGLRRGAVSGLGKNQHVIPSSFGRESAKRGLTDQILDVLPDLCAVRPTLLVVDEFGKNLEAYARAQSNGDPYLLQQIAELTQGAEALPLVVITMQHLSFDEYVQETSTTRRREWAKVQGRFQDIPYVETPEQSRRLISESLEQTDELADAARQWLRDNEADLAQLNLREIVDEVVGAAPLHPVTLAVLPELCVRYGQNERTLFSFIGGSEPLALPQLLKAVNWQPGDPLQFVGLDCVYDYFIESVRSMVGVSQSASRWIEVETRIRDTAGLSTEELRAMKTVGLLNLISTGGRVRASRALLEFVLTDYENDKNAVSSLLDDLERRGLIAHRTFSDEYRIWQGSDYDLKRAITSARRQVDSEPLADLLNEVAELQPAVAGRHSQRGGILRIFGQRFGLSARQDDVERDWDGLVLYATADNATVIEIDLGAGDRPIVTVIPGDLAAVDEAAREAAALQVALKAAQDEQADWVAIRELSERAATARQSLLGLIGETWDSEAEWQADGLEMDIDAGAGLSSALSQVADRVYSSAPQVKNEMIARRELTSQGAKARRFLIDAMLESSTFERFGLEGYGPERAIYEAVFRWTGIHRRGETPDDTWVLRSPTDRRWKVTWAALTDAIDATDDRRVPLPEITRVVELPPYGLKAGIVPLVVIALLLSRRDDVALYEHGSLVLEIDDAVAERLAKNPWHFAVRNSATKGAARSEVVTALAERMKVRAPGGSPPSFLNVMSALFRELRLLPPYVQKTKSSVSPTAIAVREAFHTATEPDVLMFETLPGIFGLNAIGPRSRRDRKAAHNLADKLAMTIGELKDCYPTLLGSVAGQVAEATSLPASLETLHARLRARAIELEERVLEPRLRAFVGALTRDLDSQAWLENVAMVVAEGQAPRVWTDDVAGRFPLRIAELGGAMRRTEALLYDRLARDEQGGFQTTRVALTQADGSEWNELVAISDDDRDRIDEPFNALVDELAKDFGSRAAVCRMLMARLAIEEFGERATPETQGSEGVSHG